MKKSTLLISALIALTACAQNPPYKVTVPVPDKTDGTMAYMINYDTGEKIDSVAVKDQKAYFTGDVEDPIIVRFITGDNARYGTAVLEQGASTINQETRMGVGTMLNDQMHTVIDELNGIAQKLQSTQSEEEAMALYQQYLDTEKKYIVENIDNPLGYFFFVDYTASVPPEEIIQFTDKYPSLKEYSRVKSAIEAARKVEATAEGKPYTDFEVAYNGKTSRLSDYVGDGHYLLVDFWASWCGPCRREMATLKELYNEYKDKGLQVLGVAVWDQPADTERAMKELDIPWPVIINAQKIPTDLYGIQGIPCILLIGPDGTILSRGKQGAELKAEVAKAMSAQK